MFENGTNAGCVVGSWDLRPQYNKTMILPYNLFNQKIIDEFFHSKAIVQPVN